MPTGRDLVNKLMTCVGDRYVFGAEVRLSDPNPRVFDCSEIIEWGTHQIGVRFPDGSGAQIAACHQISVKQAMGTPGALLWKPGHIATSRGNGTTIEAKGRNYGVNVFPAGNRFTKGGLIPALSYAKDPARPSDSLPGLKGPTAHELQVIAWCVALCKTQVLRPGDRNDYVIWLQAGINNISGHGLVKDGHFGPATERAVREVQGFFRRIANGIVDRATWNVIYP